MEIRIRVPRIAAGALSNLVGLLGLLAVAVAIGGLTGSWWWSALTAGLFAVALAALAQAGAQAAPAKTTVAVAAAKNLRPATATPEAKAS